MKIKKYFGNVVEMPGAVRKPHLPGLVPQNPLKERKTEWLCCQSSFHLQIMPKTCYDAIKPNQFTRSVADAK